jgi:hypothetical protein
VVQGHGQRRGGMRYAGSAAVHGRGRWAGQSWRVGSSGGESRADMFTVQPGPTTGPSAPHRLTPPTLGSNMYPVGHRAPQPWCRLECVDMPLPRLSAHISPLARLAVITPLHERPVSRGLGHVSSSTCIM